MKAKCISAGSDASVPVPADATKAAEIYYSYRFRGEGEDKGLILKIESEKDLKFLLECVYRFDVSKCDTKVGGITAPEPQKISKPPSKPDISI